jgi:hypothetical protein
MVGSFGSDTIDGGGGANTIEFTSASASDVASTNVSGGVTTVTFNDGQEVSYSNVQTIKFDL